MPVSNNYMVYNMYAYMHTTSTTTAVNTTIVMIQSIYYADLAVLHVAAAVLLHTAGVMKLCDFFQSNNVVH